ncbi:MAG: DUF1343 domain-containing protein [Calditrichaeota bacterium]|nr:MAG: DUF1343 domain-containing protein [Calditrichota bacterium]
MRNTVIIVILLSQLTACTAQVLVGLDRVLEFEHLFQGKRIGIVCNQTAVDRNRIHIIDRFSAMENVQIQALFALEHGLWGTQEAGERIAHQLSADRIQIFSLYGASRKPTPQMLSDIDMLVLDVQDIGARFYTYIWTMAEAMTAAAERGIPFVVLDRPNPLNGLIMEGPMLEREYVSFIGMFPIPVRHGLTIGELARMFAGEGWLDSERRVELTVVPLRGWRRAEFIDADATRFIPPSPNIPTPSTALIYAGTCLLEGTNVSEGRGTESPFLSLGAPWIQSDELLRSLAVYRFPGITLAPIEFVPHSLPGRAMNPKYRDTPCHGIMIRVNDWSAARPFTMGVLLVKTIHDLYPHHFVFNADHFDRLCGTRRIRIAIERGEDIEPILSAWEGDLEGFDRLRSRYLLYSE